MVPRWCILLTSPVSLPSLALFFLQILLFTMTLNVSLMNNVCSACHKPVCVMCILLAPFPDAHKPTSWPLHHDHLFYYLYPVCKWWHLVCLFLTNRSALLYCFTSTQPSPPPPSCFRPYLELSHQLNPSPDAKGRHVHLDGMRRAVTKHAARPCMNRRVEHEKGDVIRKPEHVHTLN